MEIINILILLLLAAAVILLVALFVRSGKKDTADTERLLRNESDRISDVMRRENSELRTETANALKTALDVFSGQISAQLKTVADSQAEASRQNAESIKSFGGLMQNQFTLFADAQKTASQKETEQLYELRRTIEANLRAIQEDNTKQLEKMRETVDEKLSATLEKRLNESFEAVSKQLESVYKGLGEMQTLASSVGDLKNALTNVKVRGTWGEVSLDSLLSQILSPEQFERNVKPNPRSNNIVEFCIRLPNNDDNKIVYLPVDCKFPLESYIRLCEASEKGDAQETEAAGKQLEAQIKSCARDIRNKYITPPYTTDFAIMYLPIEGLYAEVVRREGLCESLQRDCRVTVAGPTTIGAFLNSLQLGFKTLAIQKRTSEIATLLVKIKKNFGTFSELLEKTGKKLGEAQSTVEDLSRRYTSIGNLLDKADSFSPAEPPASITENNG